MIAVIPARGGSKRIPGKNIRPFHGKPIIAYSIATAQESGLFSGIYVSTEDAAVATVARDYGARVIARPPELAEIGAPDCGTQEVMRHALLSLGITEGDACCIYATAPLMRPADLVAGHALLGEYVYSVGPDGDAGQWYFGLVQNFLDRVPLSAGTRYPLPAERVCDINVEADWLRAEALFD